MDREKTIELGNQVYNIINSQLRMLEEFLLKKGKERNKINLFIGTISQFPVRIVLNFYLAAIEYYIAKYNVFKLSSNISSNNRIILLY
jgi:hypothetical protein